MPWLVVLLDEAEDLVDFIGDDVPVLVLVVLHVPLFLASGTRQVIQILFFCVFYFYVPFTCLLFFRWEWENKVVLGRSFQNGVGLSFIQERLLWRNSREYVVDARLRDELILHDSCLSKATPTLRQIANQIWSAI